MRSVAKDFLTLGIDFNFPLWLRQADKIFGLEWNIPQYFSTQIFSQFLWSRSEHVSVGFLSILALNLTSRIKLVRKSTRGFSARKIRYKYTQTIKFNTFLALILQVKRIKSWIKIKDSDYPNQQFYVFF